MNIPFIDLKTQYNRIKTNIDSAINKVLEHGQYIMGPEIKELELKLANYVGSKHAFLVSSGTDALLISLMAIDIKTGDEVIIPDFSFFATAEVISLLGAKPVFCDVDKNTYNINYKKIESLITAKTKAIMPVSLYGQVYASDELNSIAKKHNLTVIEDACQSFGATYKNKKSCNLSDFGCTSFFPSKPLGCYGDGGAIFTNNDIYAKIVSEIRNHGQSSRYNHTRLGLNGRLDTIQAAILLEKFNIFEEELELRQEIANRYTSNLKHKFKTPYIYEHNVSVWAQYTIEVEDRDKLENYLKENNIPSAVHYPIPISKQKYYNLDTNNCPVASEVARKVISLPMSPYLSSEHQEYIIDKLLNY